MRKNILITVLALLIFALPVLAAADFTADGNIVVSGVTLYEGGSTDDLLILTDSTAESFNFNSSVFTVTNPGSAFKVGSSNSTVKSVYVKKSGADVACAVNSTPGTSYVSLPTTAADYVVYPSTNTGFATADCCSAVSNAASYNAFPTCGAASCNGGYVVEGSGSSATCRLIGGGGPIGGGGGGDGGRISTPTLPYPNGSLLRSNNSDRVYIIDQNKKRWIPTGEVFTANGYSWLSVKVVDPSILEQYSEGSNIQKAAVPSTPTAPSTASISEGALIRAKGDIDVYIVKYVGNKKFKRLILSPSVFNSYGHLKWSDIKDVDKSVVDSFVTSDLVRAVGDTNVYKLYPAGDTGEKRWIKTATAFNRMGFDWDAIYEINTTDRNSYVTGAVIE